MLKIIYGDEPYLVSAEKEKLVGDRNSLDVMTFNAVTEAAMDFLSVPSFLGGTKAAVFSVDKLEHMDTKGMEYYWDNPPQEVDILIFPKEIDRKTKFFKKLDKKGYISFFNKVTDVKKIQTLMFRKLERLEATITEEAYREFFMRMDYLNNDDINLLHLMKEMEKLAFHTKAISVEHVQAMTPDYRQGNKFAFENILLRHDADELERQLSRLTSEEQFSLLPILLKSYRVAYKEKLGFTKQEIDYKVNRFRDLSVEELVKAMEIITGTMEAVKQGRISNAQGSRIALHKLLAIGEKGGN